MMGRAIRVVLPAESAAAPGRVVLQFRERAAYADNVFNSAANLTNVTAFLRQAFAARAHAN
jgi:hypothetical protein